MNEIEDIDKIYILHHLPLIDRKEAINKKLLEEGIKELTWVENFLPEEIDYEKEISGWENVNNIFIEQPYFPYWNFCRKISLKSLSLVLKHEWCYMDQVNNNYNNILILEDDADIPDNFKDFLNKCMKEFLFLKNIEVEMMFMGTTENFVPLKNNETRYVFFNKNQKTRCTHAYVSNISATKKILQRFRPINLPIDFKLNEIIQLENIRVAWSEPGIRQKINIK